MIKILYSSLGNEDFNRTKCKELFKKGIRGIVCDFTPDSDLVYRLNEAGITENSLRVKLYDFPSLEDIELLLKRAQKLGFKYFAIDAEPYSDSKIWVTDYAIQKYYGQPLIDLIKKYYKEIVIYPEDLGGEKYLYWPQWFEMMARNFRVHLLMERTYQVWKPWEMDFYYNRANKYCTRYGVKIYPGFWQEAMWFGFRQLQKFFAERKYGRIFWYTETKEVN